MPFKLAWFDLQIQGDEGKDHAQNAPLSPWQENLETECGRVKCLPPEVRNVHVAFHLSKLCKYQTSLCERVLGCVDHGDVTAYRGSWASAFRWGLLHLSFNCIVAVGQ